MVDYLKQSPNYCLIVSFSFFVLFGEPDEIMKCSRLDNSLNAIRFTDSFRLWVVSMTISLSPKKKKKKTLRFLFIRKKSPVLCMKRTHHMVKKKKTCFCKVILTSKCSGHFSYIPIFYFIFRFLNETDLRLIYRFRAFGVGLEVGIPQSNNLNLELLFLFSLNANWVSLSCQHSLFFGTILNNGPNSFNVIWN